MYDFKLRPKPTAEENQRAAGFLLTVAEVLDAAHAQGRQARPPKPKNFPGGFVVREAGDVPPPAGRVPVPGSKPPANPHKSPENIGNAGSRFLPILHA
jgi:hypothetical protein